MTLDDYLDAAVAKAGLTSDRHLSRELGFKGNPATFWRTKKAWPSDIAMVAIARMAGEDPAQALLDLNTWRSEGEARSIYERLAEKIAKTAAAIVIALVAGHLYPTDAQARTALERPVTAQDAVYYGKY